MEIKAKKPRAKREKSTSTKGHYVRNADLLPAVIEAKELGHVTAKLIKMIEMIAERYSRKSWFIGYSYREDMVSSAVENLCKNALKFNHLKYKNPFAYYTTAINNSFSQYKADEKKQRNIRDALLLQAGSNPSFNFGEDEKDEHHFELKESDEHYIPEKKLDDEEQLAEGVVLPEAIPEQKIRYAGRVPGAVQKYGPGDFEVDPDTGAITIKPEARARYETPKQEEVLTPVKKKKEVVKAVKTATSAKATKLLVEEKKKADSPKKEKATAVKAKAPAKKLAVKAVKPAKTVAAKKTSLKK